MSVRSKVELLKELRNLMKCSVHIGETPINAYIVPSGDAHQSEYLADSDKRRAFISGFTGSAGTAVITENSACMWTDGRYFLQALSEMSSDWTLMKEGIPSTPSLGTWLVKNLPSSSRVGFDPQLMTFSTYRPLHKQLEAAGINLVAVNQNLVDVVWGSEAPHRPMNPILTLPMKYTGLLSSAKVAKVREQLAEKNALCLILTALDQVAWLFNLRGSDIPYNPVFFSYAAVSTSEICLFVDESKLSPSVSTHFKEEGIEVSIRPYHSIKDYVKSILEKLTDGEKLWICEGSSYDLCSLVPEKMLLTEVSPVAVLKCTKNKTEIEGMINCHIRDAAALCCYFAWLEEEVKNGKCITEISGADKLETLRQMQEEYVGLSFATISSVGPNAAIIHYMPEPETDRKITESEFYLCDSGGQYKDGTTDVTRTIHFGTASQYERECFTRVFKGQYALRTSIFPNKIKGNCLDTLARKPLWDVGLDYMHGTSHGIGSYLNVHEGPIGVSWRNNPDDPGMQADMFLSNEPGYYEDGSFGIRLENIVRVVPAVTQFNFKDRGFLTFEDITLVPIQTNLLVKDMLTIEEIKYVNTYHSLCREKVGALLQSQNQEKGLAWLIKESEPI